VKTYILENGVVTEEPDMNRWMIWCAKNESHVNLTKVAEYTISTIFLGIDHNFSSEGPPVVFETMLFGENLNEKMVRTSTLKEAKQCHRDAVDFVTVKIEATSKAKKIIERNE